MRVAFVCGRWRSIPRLVSVTSFFALLGLRCRRHDACEIHVYRSTTRRCWQATLLDCWQEGNDGHRQYSQVARKICPVSPQFQRDPQPKSRPTAANHKMSQITCRSLFDLKRLLVCCTEVLTHNSSELWTKNRLFAGKEAHLIHSEPDSTGKT